MTLDNLIRTPDNNDDEDDIKFAAIRNKPRPIFNHPSGLGSGDRDIQASSTLNKYGNSGDLIVIQDEDTDSSGNDSSEEQDGNQGPLNTPSTAVAG
ncbi:hypothetical protein N7G274_004395 [Stereocaulon virgatum]|uniref:Uncharacterized protein n=1 Tax=Stereocaulon virgatum TaxID=373712 RepID=A0ABR4ACR4_9LECA